MLLTFVLKKNQENVECTINKNVKFHLKFKREKNMKKVVLILRPVNRLELSNRGLFSFARLHLLMKEVGSIRGAGYANLPMCLRVV